ncbi:MAG: cytochrome b/b6 domain-containing protein [Mariprofundaceae bacterium]
MIWRVPLNKEDYTLVWNPTVRVFHWSLVLCFSSAYLTALFGYDELHGYFGYAVTILVLFRLCLGCIGSEHVRFSSFFFSIREVFEHVVSIAKNESDRHLGHSPAGAAMVFALLALLILNVATGLTYQAWGEFEGPLWALGVNFQDDVGLAAEQIHYLLPDALLLLVAFHIFGVVVASWQHRENLPHAMIHGHKLTPEAHEEQRLAADRREEERRSVARDGERRVLDRRADKNDE